MQELEFSVFDHGEDGIARLRTLLDQFKQEKQIRVHLDVMPWSGGWPKMVSVALYRHGPDISEIGSTWIGDFVRMDALRPFTSQNIQRIGGKEKFLTANWASGMASGSSTSPEVCWAIPWSADTRPVLYRRDLLQKAGINESTAFQNAEIFEITLGRLRDSGIETPLVLITQRSRLTIHMLASWVWGTGGEFINKDFSQVSFHKPEALQGMRAYFKLGRYLPAHAQALDEGQTNDMFLRGDAAVTIGGHWILSESNVAPVVKANMGAASVPGVPFVGGLHLVIWKHTFKEEAALQLIEFLSKKKEALSLFPSFGLPARVDGFDVPPFSTDSNYKTLAQMGKVGRSFPSGHLWGLVENRLVDVFPVIWKEVLSSPKADIDQVLQNYLTPLAQRLNITVQS